MEAKKCVIIMFICLVVTFFAGYGNTQNVRAEQALQNYVGVWSDIYCR
ncbi:hypothetical protein [Butyrivibrio sp. LC3010]|nr:hypothetical protein [Butyrivibrio sp. LC3010]